MNLWCCNQSSSIFDQNRLVNQRLGFKGSILVLFQYVQKNHIFRGIFLHCFLATNTRPTLSVHESPSRQKVVTWPRKLFWQEPQCKGHSQLPKVYPPPTFHLWSISCQIKANYGREVKKSFPFMIFWPTFHFMKSEDERVRRKSIIELILAQSLLSTLYYNIGRHTYLHTVSLIKRALRRPRYIREGHT